MRTDIKAIETIYKGYRFRSRLEARWAVFFDALGVSWEYEPEGFELDCGSRYLPDFRLATIHGLQWVEIKGVMPTDAETGKLCALHDPKSDISFGLLMVGPPGSHQMAYCSNFGDMHQVHWLRAAADPRLMSFYLEPPGGVQIAVVERAIDAARAARFEFGETGGRP